MLIGWNGLLLVDTSATDRPVAKHPFSYLNTLGQDPCPCAFYIVDMVPYTISKLSAKSQFCAIQTADNTDGKVRIEIILLLENNKMLPGKIKTEKK